MRPTPLVFGILLGCGLPAGVRTPATASLLAVHPVDWNPSHAAIPPARHVADIGPDVVIFSDGAATIFGDGAVTNVDKSVSSWAFATTIPAPDGSGLWIAGVDQNGQLWRLRARKSFEPVSERYGLARSSIREVCGFGGKYVGFVLDRELAVADGSEVVRYASPALHSLVAGGVDMAALGDRGVWTLDAQARSERFFSLPDAAFVAADDQGHVYAATRHEIYSQRDDGTLALRYEATGNVRGLVASHDRVWFTDDGELGVVGATEVSRSRGAKVAADARLESSPSGDVWAIDGHGGVSRWAAGEAMAGAGRVRWEDAVAPVYGRVCSTCHASDGSAGIDLSTADRWRAKRDLVRQRVLMDGDMPPQNHPISEDDRQSVKRWLDSPSP